MRRLLLVCALAVSIAGARWEPVGATAVRYQDRVFTSVAKSSNIAFGEAVDQQGTTVTLRLDLYQPTGDTAAMRPLVVWVHGGGFRRGDKSSSNVVDAATDFAHRGYVTASINYRLSPNGCEAGLARLDRECRTAITQAREDAQTAVAFLRSQASAFGIDPTRIAISGGSAGGITALNVAFSSAGNSTSSVRAAVSTSGASLLTPVDAGDSPVLLFNGTADEVVPFPFAQATVDDAKAVGVRAVLVAYEGEGHSIYRDHRTEILDTSAAFLFGALDLAHAPL